MLVNKSEIATVAEENQDPASHDRAPRCRTRSLVDNFYVCQSHTPDCKHAARFGMVWLCRSPLRREFSQ
ncbi:MAG TPA: hypothetical protein VIU41_11760 [Geobacteraceae bacterium]